MRYILPALRHRPDRRSRVEPDPPLEDDHGRSGSPRNSVLFPSRSSLLLGSDPLRAGSVLTRHTIGTIARLLKSKNVSRSATKTLWEIAILPIVVILRIR